MFLLVMSASFDDMLQTGLIGAKAARVLVASCEHGLDHDSFEAQWRVLEPVLSLPSWLTALYSVRQFRSLLKPLVVSRMAIAVEIAAAFVRSVQLSAQNIIETVCSDAVEDAFILARSDLEAYVQRASDMWLTIQVRYNDLHRIIQARHLTQFVLHRELQLVLSLHKKGILEEIDCNRMRAMVEDRMRMLVRTLRAGVGLAVSIEERFHQCDIIHAMPSGVRSALFAQSQSQIVQQNAALFEVGDATTGVFVLLHGVLIVESPGGQQETYASGKVVGLYEALTGARHTCTAIAATNIEIRLLPLDVLAALIEDDDLAAMLWTYAGRSLAISAFSHGLSFPVPPVRFMLLIALWLSAAGVHVPDVDCDVVHDLEAAAQRGVRARVPGVAVVGSGLVRARPVVDGTGRGGTLPAAANVPPVPVLSGRSCPAVHAALGAIQSASVHRPARHPVPVVRHGGHGGERSRDSAGQDAVRPVRASPGVRHRARPDRASPRRHVRQPARLAIAPTPERTRVLRQTQSSPWRRRRRRRR